MAQTLDHFTEEEIAQIQDLTDFYRGVIDGFPVRLCLFEIRPDGGYQLALVSNHIHKFNYVDPAEVLGKMPQELYGLLDPRMTLEGLNRVFQTRQAFHEERLSLINGEEFWIDTLYAPIFDDDNRVLTHIVVMYDDITEAKKIEAAERQQELDLIQHQASQLAELSTPILSISQDTLVMPLVGAIDSRRIQQIMEELLNSVSNTRAKTIIIDITGVSIVDTQVADSIIRASQAVRLLGAQVLLTGIRPEVAQTLVGLGVNLANIVTRGTLRDGITYALRSR
jgi:rsbT co-antagonist protein RsbR